MEGLVQQVDGIERKYKAERRNGPGTNRWLYKRVRAGEGTW
jgi:hypothetical protein